MNKESVDKIIRSFYGKQFSEPLRRLFGQWLRTDSASKEKEEVIEELWRESPSVATTQTYTDWTALQKRIHPDSISRRQFFIRPWLRYTAVILLMITTGLITYLTTNKDPLATSSELVEVFVAHAESEYVQLPDGSGVWVNPGSLLVYPKEFTVTDRSVFLSGEATFRVKQDLGKPFFVKTGHMDVEVLGTTFTVKSYPNESFTSTTLEEGSVRVSIKDGRMEQSVLKPGEQLVYSHVDHSFSIHNVDMDMYRLERKGYLIFEDVSFRQLIPTIERKYNVVIHYNTQQYEGHKYTVKFAPDETIEEVLSILQRLIGIKYVINENIIFIN